MLGDSISAAYGIEKSAGWVALLEKELEQRCRDFPVINASVSGETTAGGNGRLAALLDKHAPQIVIIELGGNDGLRGLSPIAMGNNLAQMIEKAVPQTPHRYCSACVFPQLRATVYPSVRTTVPSGI